MSLRQTCRMPRNDDHGFAERLKLALTRNPKPIDSSAELAVQFNLRHPGSPVSQQATHKWLTGQARPTQDKISTLAEWLGVSAHWLRYGVPESQTTISDGVLREVTGARYQIDPGREEDVMRLLEGFCQLRPVQRQLIVSLVEQLLLERQSPDTEETP